MGRKTLSNQSMGDASDEFEHLYKVNVPVIYRFMFWRTQDDMLAQDLTSSVFLKAWRTRNNFAGGSSKAWLFRIARTTLIDHWRLPKGIPDGEAIIEQAESTAPEIAETIDEEMSADRLYEAIGQLPEMMARVVRLRFIEGRSAREVGEQMQLSEANVRVIQFRALQKLRKLLKHD